MSFWSFWQVLFKKPNPVVSSHQPVPPVIPPQPEVPSVATIQPLDLMKVHYVESPNKSDRQKDIRYIVLHHTGPGSFKGIVKWLCNPQAKASAHYVLGTDGELTQLVNTSKRAWHAGVSKWDGLSDINQYSIGIEICNIGVINKSDDDGEFYYEQGRDLVKYTGNVQPVAASITYPSGKILEGFAVPYPEAQINKLVALCKGLVQKYPQIKAEHIITHYDIGQPEGRKNDPFGLDLDQVRKLIFD